MTRESAWLHECRHVVVRRVRGAAAEEYDEDVEDAARWCALSLWRRDAEEEDEDDDAMAMAGGGGVASVCRRSAALGQVRIGIEKREKEGNVREESQRRPWHSVCNSHVRGG